MNAPSGPAFRQHVRLAAQDVRAGVRIEETEEWIPVAVGDISLGGAFLIVDHYIVEGTRVDVGLAFPSGIQIVLPSEIARALETNEHGPGGVGVEFLAPTMANRQALKREIDQRLGNLPEPTEEEPQLATGDLLEELPTQPVPAPARAPAQTELTGTIYERLRLPPDTDDATFAAQFDAFVVSVEQQATQAPPGSRQQQSLAIFKRSLERLRPLTGDPLKRAAYDFNNGIVRAEERIAAAAEHRGPPLAHLQKAWARIYRSEVREAKRLLMESRKGGPDAGALLARALVLDPFNEHALQSAAALTAAPPAAAPLPFEAPAAAAAPEPADAPAVVPDDDDDPFAGF